MTDNFPPKKRVALLGSHPQFSLSPAIHNRAFQAVGLPWRYDSLLVPEGDDARLSQTMASLKDGEFAGVNVTVPHKCAVMAHVDRLTPAAAAIGAVNTIRVERDGTLSGHNTDAEGFLRSLVSQGIEIQGKDAIVFGAGGAARAVLWALINGGIGSILVVNRNLERAVDAIQSFTPPETTTLECLGFDAFEAWLGKTEAADLVINTTPLGSQPLLSQSPWPAQFPIQSSQHFIDLIYNPSPTLFGLQAVNGGAFAMDGLGMLVEQAALSFTYWTGCTAPISVMFEAAREGLC